MRALLFILVTFVPAVAQAQTPGTFKELVDVFLGIIDILFAFLFALTFLVFLWGLTRAWIIGGGNEQSVQEGKQIAIWGIVVFVVLVSIWGILALLRGGLFGL